MKPISPHDPLDELIVAALHGELTPQERIEFDSRLQTDPAARAAYDEAKLMHDLLEKTHTNAQPDPAFEQRMVSGVRRKIQDEERHQETAWESVVAVWTMLQIPFRLVKRIRVIEWVVLMAILTVLAGVALGPITSGIKKAKGSAAMQAERERQLLAMEGERDGFQNRNEVKLDQVKAVAAAGALPSTPPPEATTPDSSYSGKTRVSVDDNSPVFDKKVATLAVAPAALMQKAVLADISTDTPSTDSSPSVVQTPNPAVASVTDTRKLIHNAQLDLEVKSYQIAADQITELTKQAGGYVDTSNSQKGGNGKLQGTVVVKVLPQNLESFLFKLRDLGQITNQSVSTEDVTKDYYDTQARLENSRKMEAQLQELLKRTNGKVSELLQVERELGRVRGEIEQMQGSLKLYDFQVQYATVTIAMREKDLNQAAAYLLKEQDQFALFATDVEATFQKARQTADDFKAQILQADLNHISGSDVSAELVVMVAPDQIESFLAQIRSLGRVANFTRQTQRVAKDGGESNDPADQTLTEKDKVQVHLSIRSDDETRKQVALTVVTSTVDTAFEQAKAAALANAGVGILSSSLNKTAQGQSTAQLSLRVPGKDYSALIESLKGLGRTASLSIQRNDDSGPGANGDDAPVIVSLSLTDEEVPLQQTEMAVLTTGVNDKAQQLKKDAADAGVQVKASSFELQPDGTEMAQMTFRLPMAKYPAFVETLKKLGRVESLTVRREDRPDQARTDETAPAEISLRLHNQGEIVPDDSGLWATLRQTFGQGAGALFASVRIIGVIVAFLAPWVFVIGLAAWVGRRIYLWRKGRK